MTKIRFWEQKLGYQLIRGKNCEVCLEKRPTYCDRGKSLAKVFVNDSSKLQIDHQDGWPRYYFFEKSAKQEIEEWLRIRDEI